FICHQARNKPADGGGHVNQKNATGQKATPPCQKGASTKGGPKTPVKPSAQKGAAKTAPPKQAAAAAVKTPQGKKKKGHKHQQYELIVTINLENSPSTIYSPFYILGRGVAENQLDTGPNRWQS
ncbi:hypothetical protein RR46_11422, partial [Papilio xuthus]